MIIRYFFAMVYRHIFLFGLLFQWFCNGGPISFVDDWEFLPAIVAKEWNHRFGNLQERWKYKNEVKPRKAITIITVLIIPIQFYWIFCSVENLQIYL